MHSALSFRIVCLFLKNFCLDEKHVIIIHSDTMSLRHNMASTQMPGILFNLVNVVMFQVLVLSCYLRNVCGREEFCKQLCSYDQQQAAIGNFDFDQPFTPYTDGETLIFNAGQEHKVLVMGDSHSQQLIPKWKDMLKKLGSDKCPSIYCRNIPLDIFSPGSFVPSPHPHDKFFNNELTKLNFTSIILTSYWEAYISSYSNWRDSNRPDEKIGYNFTSPWQGNLFQRLADVMKKQVERGVQVYILMQYPTGHKNDPCNLAVAPEKVPTFLFSEFKMQPQIQLIRLLIDRFALHSGSIVLEPAVSFCEGDVCCPLAPDGRPAFKDANHVRPFFVMEHYSFLNVALGVPTY